MPLPRRMAAACAAVAFAAAAAEPPPAVRTCQACHGREGVSASLNIPNLAGQKALYLATQLKAFRAGSRKHELMAAIAGQLSDADIEALAAFWSQQPPGGAAALAEVPSLMRFPAGFPAGFTEYSREEQPEGQGFSLRYANAAALDAARAGRPLPEGSVIIVANHAARRGAGGGFEPGAVQSYSGMETRAGWADAVPSLLRNGGWHYGLFSADGSPRIGAAHAQCLACHLPAAAESYVFTLPLLKRHAGGG